MKDLSVIHVAACDQKLPQFFIHKISSESNWKRLTDKVSVSSVSSLIINRKYNVRKGVGTDVRLGNYFALNFQHYERVLMLFETLITFLLLLNRFNIFFSAVIMRILQQIPILVNEAKNFSNE